MQNHYQHRRHNKNLLMVHLIFVVKYRKSILYGQMREDVKQHIFDACVKHHWYICTMETDRDHIHILLQYNPSDSVTKIVGVLKSYSTYHIWRVHGPALSQYFWNEHTLWSDGYFACSIGNISKETIEKYIENQG